MESLFINLLIVLLAFVAMEGVAWFSHKYLMHGLFWYLHKDHHKRNLPASLSTTISSF